MSKTKAILFADGNAQKFQAFNGKNVYKESLQEADYKDSKSVHVSESLSLNAGESNDVVTINDQQVSILVFEDGSVYDVSKGFRSVVSENVQKEIDIARHIIATEESQAAEKKAAEAEAKAAEAKKVAEAKAAEKKAEADKKAAEKATKTATTTETV